MSRNNEELQGISLLGNQKPNTQANTRLKFWKRSTTNIQTTTISSNSSAPSSPASAR